ncbi:hypothetical protein WJX74_008633 [Apatococcus lobatus]|uniref:SET domain-containing protein n=1 Tax=Apatococcus lobatus TaxID=904363 RepID=A0AAW1Q7E1_9CHLO
MPEGSNIFQVALFLYGTEACSRGGLQMVEATILDQNSLQQLQAAGKAAEVAADPKLDIPQQPVPQYPVDPPGSISIKNFAQLLRDIGIWAPKVTVKTFPNGMRGVQAVDTIRKGTNVMLFPFAKAILLDSNRPESPFPEFITDDVWKAHFWRQYPFNAAVVLLHEISKGAKSGMHKYLSMLPDAVDTLWQWSAEELDEMQIDGMRGIMADRQQELRAAWHVLDSADVKMPNMTWKAFCWASTIISSRSFQFNVLEGLANPRNRLLAGAAVFIVGLCLLLACVKLIRWSCFCILICVLIPFPPLTPGSIKNFLTAGSVPAEYIGLLPGLDLFNHQALLPQHDIYMSNPGQPEQWSWKQSLDQYVRIVAAKDLLPGQEVFLFYGQKSNFDLLRSYGFLVPGNLWDEYLMTNFSAQLAEASAIGVLAPFAAAGRHLDILNDFEEAPSLGPNGVNFNDRMRLQNALQHHSTVEEARALKSGMTLDEHAAMAIWKLFGYACRQELVGKATTPEEDDVTLSAAGDETTWRFWNALQLRIGHKKLLKICANQADAAVAFLQIQHDDLDLELGHSDALVCPLQLHSEL